MEIRRGGQKRSWALEKHEASLVMLGFDWIYVAVGTELMAAADRIVCLRRGTPSEVAIVNLRLGKSASSPSLWHILKASVVELFIRKSVVVDWEIEEKY